MASTPAPTLRTRYQSHLITPTHRHLHTACTAVPNDAPLPDSTTATIPDIAPIPLDTDTLPTWAWSEPDAFSALGDRVDAPPLPLPSLPPRTRRRVVLVRHGQSTWNARSRIQGSSDFSVLTEEGVRQAEAAAAALGDWKFDALFASPLKRAARTAEVVWGPRNGPISVLPSLREVDLYSFQGLDKAAGRAAHPAAYETWQQRPAEFCIDGHWPVRELWHRASLAWREIFTPDSGAAPLVVAHNAVNQALICTALGLDPPHFRRITQTNAAFSVLDFEWGDDGAPAVTVERLNFFPEGPLRNEKPGRAGSDRLVLVAGDAASPAVAAALREVAAGAAPPLVGVGPPGVQAADVATALGAVLATPRPAQGRRVVAVASPEACQLLLARCLGAPDSVGKRFRMDEGGVTVFNYHKRQPQTADPVAQGLLLCANYVGF